MVLSSQKFLQRAQSDGCENLLEKSGVIARQSSTAYGGRASLAIDGNTDGNYWHRSCEHTGFDKKNTWWQAEMPTSEHVAVVEIFNREDCCTWQLANF